MSFLQHGHVSKAFYTRTEATYLKTSSELYLDVPQNEESYLKTNFSKSYLNSNRKTYLEVQPNSFLKLQQPSYLTSNNKTYLKLENEICPYLKLNADSFINIQQKHFLKITKNNTFLEEDDVQHYIPDNEKDHYLQESEGETSDEEGENYCHIVDWSLISPPHFTKLTLTTKEIIVYRCEITGAITAKKPVVFDRFEIFDLTKKQLILLIARYDCNSTNDSINLSVRINNCQQLYQQLLKNISNLHTTNLQPRALENLRNWKHNKEHELLDAVSVAGVSKIVKADYSVRTERMGILNATASSAAQRKQQRILLQQQQLQERQQLKIRKNKQRTLNQQSHEQRIRNDANRARFEQQTRMQHKTNEESKRRLLISENGKERIAQQNKQQKYLKIDAVQERLAYQQQLQNRMISNLEYKSDTLQNTRGQKANNFDAFLSNISTEQQKQRSDIQNIRSQKFESQDAQFKQAIENLANARNQAHSDAKNEEIERGQKGVIKKYTTKIHTLLNYKNAGIMFDDIPNEYVFKFNEDWDPQKWFKLDDMFAILTSNGLQSLVHIITSVDNEQCKRAILKEHFTKISIVSSTQNTNVSTEEILTALAISDTIDGAIQYLKKMHMSQKKSIKYNDNTKPLMSTRSNISNSSVNSNHGLPDGWKAKKIKDGRIYFFHPTKTTTWDDPRPLPFGFREATKDGKKYFINDELKTSTWTDPRPKIVM